MVYLQYLLNKISSLVPVAYADPTPIGGGGNDGLGNPTINIPQPTGGFQGGLGELVSTGINWAVAIGAVATLAFIIFGGFKYVTAGDDAEKAEGGRSAITNGVIGLIIIASAFAIFKLLVNILNLDSIFPGL